MGYLRPWRRDNVLVMKGRLGAYDDASPAFPINQTARSVSTCWFVYDVVGDGGLTFLGLGKHSIPCN